MLTGGAEKVALFADIRSRMYLAAVARPATEWRVKSTEALVVFTGWDGFEGQRKAQSVRQNVENVRWSGGKTGYSVWKA